MTRDFEVDPKESYVIIYLGKRGGGAKFTYELCQVMLAKFRSAEISIVISSQNEIRSKYHQLPLRVIELDLNKFHRKVRFILQSRVSPKSLIRKMRIRANTKVIFSMVSPIELFVSDKVHKSCFCTYRVIHDASRHPGEIWPGGLTNRFIRSQSDVLIALSQTVTEKLKSQSKKRVVTISHPVFRYKAVNTNSLQIESIRYALFLGRIRKYKGVQQLAEAWKSVGEETELTLIIAGEGKLPRIKGKNLVLINRWLTENEIQFLIKNAEFLVFPYQEASQSGWIPSAISEEKKIVITPVDGLIEQIRDYPNVVICEDVNPNAIKMGILQIIEQKFVSGKFTDASRGDWAQNLIEVLKEKVRPI